VKFRINKSKSEEELIQDCLKNDRKAQRIIYEKYAGRMYSLCLRYVKEMDEAEDVMINGFMKVFDKLSYFKGEGSFEGWIRRIMVNEALMFIRKNKAMYLVVDIEKADMEPDYHFLDVNLEVEDLMKMVNNLPIGYRTIFNLYAIEGFSHKEIAEQLNISENTSKSQLSRARTLLQKILIESERNLKEKQLSYE
jgi:RNA polymerase sigma factor (sigma-70 family)